MNDQQFVNAYVRILNDTLNEAISKNLVLQAQLDVAKNHNANVAELENKIKELSSVSTNVSSDNNALQKQLNVIKGQLDHANAQLSNKNSHVETFKKELVDARNLVKQLTSEHEEQVALLNAEIELLRKQIEELNVKKKKKEKALNTVEQDNSNLISISDSF